MEMLLPERSFHLYCLGLFEDYNASENKLHAYFTLTLDGVETINEELRIS